jgi:outer membrane protein OmpA-like peptidoglycan-associated protein
MTKKIIGIVVCLIAMNTHTVAQGLSVGLGGGLQGMQYRLPDGTDKLLPGGSLELLYTFQLKGPWNLITGLTGGVYRTQASLPDGTVFSTYQVDDEGSAFQYSMKAEGYREIQSFFAAGIPVLLQYHTTGTGTQWYINGGGKILFPSSANIKISAQQIILSGYYPDYNIELSDVPQHGFGAINGWKASASSTLRPTAALSLATGFSFAMPGGSRIYAGLYIDYGLTGLKGRRDSLPLVSYSPTGVSSVQANSVFNMTNTGQAKLLSIGLGVRLALGGTKEKPAARPKPTPAVPAAAVPAQTQQQPPAAPPSPDSTHLSTPNKALTDDDTAFIQRPLIFGVIDEKTIPAISQVQLDDVADILLQHPELRISIVGHVCNSGTETEDPKVGLARARAVARYLVSKGISRKRMAVSAVNKSDPVDPDNPAANYQKRRVVIRVQ